MTTVKAPLHLPFVLLHQPPHPVDANDDPLQVRGTAPEPLLESTSENHEGFNSDEALQSHANSSTVPKS